MKEKIWRLQPFDVTQFPRMESWLEAMAAKGWLLTDEILPFLVQFRRGEPTLRRYRIIPVTDRIEAGAEEDEIALYETYGWKHVYQRRGMEIFYTDYPNAEELFTDAASFTLRARRHLLGHGLAIAAVTLLLLNIFRSLLGLAEPIGARPLHLLHLMGGTFAIALFCCTVLALVNSGVNLTRYGRFLQKLKSGEEFRHGVPYGRALRWNTALMLLSFLTIAAVFVGIGVSHNFPETRLSSEDNGTFDLTHPLPLSEWDPAAWAKIEPCLETNCWTENMFYMEDRYSDILFSDIQMVDSEADGVRYLATWYEARSERIAERYLREELPEQTALPMPNAVTELDLPGVDYAGYAEDWGQRLYLRAGNRILTVIITGDRDLRAEAETFIENLKQ